LVVLGNSSSFGKWFVGSATRASPPSVYIMARAAGCKPGGLRAAWI
jgi:hypothetical protein